ncbi:MAG TPA: endopeptidase La [Burkholderiales bacterium]|nr:endopeptidase La [Burkholderiales bacterium]
MTLDTESNQPASAPGAGSALSPSKQGEAGSVALPEDLLIILPVRNLILFPGMILPLSIGREASIAAAQQAVRTERPIGLLLQKDPSVDSPGPDDLYRVGTLAQVLRYVTSQDGGHHLICQGEQRFIVREFVSGYPFMVARVDRIADGQQASHDIEARFLQLKKRASEALALLPQTPQELVSAVSSFTSPGGLADVVAGFLDIKPEEKQQILETFSLEKRLDSVLNLLAHRIEVLKISKEIDERTKASMDERQREFVLREQLKTIQKELGEGEEGGHAEVEELSKTVAEAGMPEEVEKHVRKELKRLARMAEASTEYSMARSYLDWLIELPWKVQTEERIDLAEARRILDEDHYGLDKVKKRILEFLAVRKLNPHGHSPILCFVGPPGVGKTSLGQSIAKALGRKFVRVSLGGVHDEAEIRGHRRTYVGALPGNIIQAIKKAGSRDCVMMLDEIDKLGQGFHGDPSSALLEVLDPEQNATFRDAYLGVPFDLSRVTFIATANMLDTIPGPLRDRMEVIPLPGYTQEEKLQIARKYLVKRQLEQNGLSPEKFEVTDEAIRAIIQDYTREAGVRNLEREIGAVCRGAAVKIAAGEAQSVRVERGELSDLLGPARFESEVAERVPLPGVATGLAWTPVGGDILFIESSRTAGNGKLILTGQLGDVMKESAQAALTLVKAHADALDIDAGALEKSDIHVHVPAGAVPKDGPSAGVAMFMSLASLLSNRAVRTDTAMTGEISLRGLVLPVGGIKEKVLAAMRAGITTVLLPKRNQKDLQEVPEEARQRLQFVFLDTVDDAVRAALPERSPTAEAVLAD